ncbi:hypothetical protein ATL31_2929 [Phycicoccus duodecadis]|uniref:Uncharacterized protein n=1 Tax=Phycicoccus duodecadis TaxID=173053 RepID=A0A2N3YML4_9MICO|nr:hypothetical protein ATL31_2929 [Phycicoccus duodecadis]
MPDDEASEAAASEPHPKEASRTRGAPYPPAPPRGFGPDRTAAPVPSSRPEADDAPPQDENDQEQGEDHA